MTTSNNSDTTSQGQTTAARKNESGTGATSTNDLDAKVAELSYEDARARLVEVVSRLEQGNIALEEAITLWELGEALARRCQAWLEGAKVRLEEAKNRSTHTLKTTDEA